MYCSHCGKKNPEQANFCFCCGTRISSAPSHIASQVDTSIAATEAEPTVAPPGNVAPPIGTVGSQGSGGVKVDSASRQPDARRPISKRCPVCHLPNRANAERCACGFRFDGAANPIEAVSGADVTVATVTALERPGVVTVLAVVQIVSSILMALLALACFAAGLSSSVSDAGVLLLGGLVLAGLGALQMFCGVGLWRLRSYGRTIQLVFSWIGLLGFPVGTLISALILVYLNKPGIKVLFSRKSVSQLTVEESTHVAALAEGSMPMAIAVILIVLVGVAVVGIGAAIAVPGLLRARMSGNEASAIGSLRAINRAQEQYAQKCNGYAADLQALKQGGQFLPSDWPAGRGFTTSGYIVSIEASATALAVNNAPFGCVSPVSDFVAHADPVTPGSTGTRYFATDARGTIFWSPSGPIANPIGPTAIPVQ